MSKEATMDKYKVLAISSGGGHWVQLLRLRPAFRECRVIFATVDQGYSGDVSGEEFRLIPDSNQWNKFALFRTFMAVLKLIAMERPDLVISTGAAPGYFGILAGRIFRARTVWIDSLANGEELSLSGKKAGKLVDLWLTQWPQLARNTGPHFKGSVL